MDVLLNLARATDWAIAGHAQPESRGPVNV